MTRSGTQSVAFARPAGRIARSDTLTPDRCVLLLLGVLALLRFCDWFWCFSLYDRRGVLMIAALATLGAFCAFFALWFLASVMLRRRFQFGLRTWVLVGLAVAEPLGWLHAELKNAQQRRDAIKAIF